MYIQITNRKLVEQNELFYLLNVKKRHLLAKITFKNNRNLIFVIPFKALNPKTALDTRFEPIFRFQYITQFRLIIIFNWEKVCIYCVLQPQFQFA